MSARRFATVVACLKLFFGVIELATGLIWLFVSPSGVQHQIERLVDWMASQQPDNPAVEMLQRQLPTLFAHGTLVAIGLVLLGSVKLAGAMGFLSGRPWGYWLFVASLVALLPFDVRSAADDGSRFAWLFVGLDLVVLTALLWFRRPLTASPSPVGAADAEVPGTVPAAVPGTVPGTSRSV
jgi:uncharacterized membrane protein